MAAVAVFLVEWQQRAPTHLQPPRYYQCDKAIGGTDSFILLPFLNNGAIVGHCWHIAITGAIRGADVENGVGSKRRGQDFRLS
jgi:hypothetical protein